MQIHAQDLDAFFKRLYDDLRAQWDDRVDDGGMTDQAFQHRLKRMDEIAAILGALSDGNAALTIKHRKRREPAPMIYLPREEE